jgi:hypothetical protein
MRQAMLASRAVWESVATTDYCEAKRLDDNQNGDARARMGTWMMRAFEVGRRLVFWVSERLSQSAVENGDGGIGLSRRDQATKVNKILISSEGRRDGGRDEKRK